MGCGLSKAHIHPEVLVAHANARTTVQGRLLIVARYRAGWPKAHIAAAMGISRKCVSRWLDRYAAEGEAGLADRSSRPHHSPRRTPVEVEDRIVQLRPSSAGGRTGSVPHWACRPARCPACWPAAGRPGWPRWTR